MKKELTQNQKSALLEILKQRFEKNMQRHKTVDWSTVEAKLKTDSKSLWSLNEMEATGGEPDVTGIDKQSGKMIFTDCSAESPAGRRSYCYDKAALDARKENKPKNNVVDAAAAMGIDLLDEKQYNELQKLGKFDCKTSSWILTPPEIRKLGGAVFCDFRYNTIFYYHNGADSYYAARGFRGSLKV